MLAALTISPREGLACAGLIERLAAEAAALAAAEPLLAGTVAPLLASDGDLLSILAWQLAGQLAGEAVSHSQLQALFSEVLNAAPGLTAIVVQDFDAALERDPASESALQILLHMKGFQALQSHRIANALWLRGRRSLALHLQAVSSRVFGVDIHPAAHIGAGIMLDHATGIVIGETSVVGDGVSIFQNVTLGGTGKARGDRHPKIGPGAVLGAGAVLLGPIRVGAGAQIGAGSVVLRDIPDSATAVGIPARVIDPRGG
ncbi:serine O-acetyltransferase [Achromobacter denitrificans]|jgi:serine O-acetyltransferase|uniref:serine O-acetyltransferase n=1 Tax=Achromobacter denitrificans TaxID=32002 RepID=UPI000B4C5D64|nr:serine O-acetyltransferase [Achromobacter denitrificans]ASC65652.1 serine O-acetyltransferase [Achromobacter denitrificans]MDF3940363.1 serine O-acetyltransferase [Achromobacter denitrificans]MPT40313.1 serine O-acetyltransferase [Achromobacter sp.]